MREINSEEFLITKEELQQLVSEGVEKHLARNQATVITQRNVFTDLSIEFNEKIIDFNFRNDIKAYSHRSVTDAIWGSQGTIALPDNVHEGIRRTTLSLLGVRKNEQLLYSELDIAREIYKSLADLSFENYKKRIEKQKNLASATNTN